jgi:hypothetical protein
LYRPGESADPRDYSFRLSICASISVTRERMSPFGFGEPRLGHVELAREPRVVVRRPRVLGAQPVDHLDEEFHFLFKPVDRLEIDVAYRYFRQDERSFNTGTSA